MERLTLDGCWAKVERAREHMHELEQLAEAFLRRHPNQIRFDKYTEPGWVILRALVEPPPVRISLVAGDLIHNLRSALDYLVWQLVRSEGGVGGTHTAFPICLSESEFDRRVRNPPKNRKSPLHGIDPSGDKWALVDRFQPYHAGHQADVEPLSALAALSNRDKHRSLLAGLSILEGFDLDEFTKSIGLGIADFSVTFDEPNFLTHETELARFRPITTGGMEVKRELPVEIALSDGDPSADDTYVVPVLALDRVRGDVVLVLRAFERFFA